MQLHALLLEGMELAFTTTEDGFRLGIQCCWVWLQLYIENILALQAKSAARGRDVRLPLAIMTSDDTHARTAALLEAHSHFGADPAQIHLLKQEKVHV